MEEVTIMNKVKYEEDGKDAEAVYSYTIMGSTEIGRLSERKREYVEIANHCEENEEGLKISKNICQPHVAEEIDLSPIDALHIKCVILFPDYQNEKMMETLEIFKGLKLDSTLGGQEPFTSSGENSVMRPHKTNKKARMNKKPHDSGNRELFVCEECKKCFSRKPFLIAHMRTHTGDMFCCAHCPFKTHYKYSLVVHMAKHTGNYYTCDHCPKKYTTRAMLKEHVAAKHERSQVFKCGLCPSTFSSRYQLSNHVSARRCASRGKLFHCSYCPFQCTSVGGLVAHTAGHTGRGSFACDLCPFRCSSKYALATHCKKHSEMPSQCPVCHLKFNHKEYLNKHLRTHGENHRFFGCTECPYKSKYKSNVKSHMRVHDRDRPFPCPRCPYAAKHHSNLKSHMSHVHTLTAKKCSFACHMCSFASRTMLELAAHIMRMHVEKTSSSNSLEEPEGAALGDQRL